MRHPSFPACPQPMPVPRDITPSTVSCGVMGRPVAAVTGKAEIYSGGSALGTVRFCSNGDSTAENNDRRLLVRLPVKRGAHFEDEEPLETRVRSREDTEKDGCVETKVEVTSSTTDAAADPCPVFDPSPLSVWQRPPPDMDPFVKLDKLPI